MWQLLVRVVLIVNIPIRHAVPIHSDVARKDSFPYAAVIKPKDESRDIFSGALITHQYVLTAASPFLSIKGEVIVSLGVYILKRGFGKGRIDQVVNVETNVIMHDEYDEDHPLYDNIALLKLPKPVSYSKSIRAVRLPTGAEEFTEYSDAKISVIGWGMRYRGHSRTTNSMNYYNTTVFPQALCTRYYPVWERNLCTDATQTGHYCVAQYGSPIVTIENPKLIAIGLDPVGCSGGVAIVNTRVAPYLYWIDMHSDYDSTTSSEEESNEEDAQKEVSTTVKEEKRPQTERTPVSEEKPEVAIEEPKKEVVDVATKEDVDVAAKEAIDVTTKETIDVVTKEVNDTAIKEVLVTSADKTAEVAADEDAEATVDVVGDDHNE